MKDIWINLMRRAEEEGNKELSDHYLEKLLMMEAQEERQTVFYVLLGVFILTLIAPFVVGFLMM